MKHTQLARWQGPSDTRETPLLYLCRWPVCRGHKQHLPKADLSVGRFGASPAWSPARWAAVASAAEQEAAGWCRWSLGLAAPWCCVSSCGLPEPAQGWGHAGLWAPHEQDFRERWISDAALPRENQPLSIPAGIPALALLVQALLQFLRAAGCKGGVY